MLYCYCYCYDNYYIKLLVYVVVVVVVTQYLVMVVFNFERLEHHYHQSNRKSNTTGVLEKDESFKLGKSYKGLSNHSNTMMLYPILHKPKRLAIRDNLEIQHWDLGLGIIVLTMAKFLKNL